MFTALVRIGCHFPAFRGGSAKHQTCLIFHQPSTTLYPDLGSAHLETVLSWISTACWSHLPSCPILLQSCLKELAGRTHKQTVLESKPAWRKHYQPHLGRKVCKDT